MKQKWLNSLLLKLHSSQTAARIVNLIRNFSENKKAIKTLATSRLTLKLRKQMMQLSKKEVKMMIST